MMLNLALNAVVSGLLLSGVYAIASLGLTITFGLLQIPNVAHPTFIVLGAYCAQLLNSFGLDPIVGGLLFAPLFYVGGVTLLPDLFPDLRAPRPQQHVAKLHLLLRHSAGAAGLADPGRRRRSDLRQRTLYRQEPADRPADDALSPRHSVPHRRDGGARHVVAPDADARRARAARGRARRERA